MFGLSSYRDGMKSFRTKGISFGVVPPFELESKLLKGGYVRV